MTEKLRRLYRFWRDRNAPTVAVWAELDRGLLDQQPAIVEVIETDLRPRLDVAGTLSWRWTDLRWSLTNARRALAGRPMLELLPYTETVSVMVNDHHPDAFIRNVAVVLAERHRRVAP